MLPEDAVVGTPAAEYYHLESDWMIEIDITANRADALSHYGVARDLYAWLLQRGYKTSLHRPDCSKFNVDNEDLTIDVEIENNAACKRYTCVTVTDCEVKDSPKWMQDKLIAVGLRPINNIVDITNYIVHELGQPLHCFDADVVGKRVIVKTMPEGTPFTTLDGVERKLSDRDLMICNENGPMCIAGVFGGLDSGVTENTVNVFLESAYFHPTWVRKTARRYALNTDASFRFERGIDPLYTDYVLKHEYNKQDDTSIRKVLKYELYDTLFSMIAGWAINSAMDLVSGHKVVDCHSQKRPSRHKGNIAQLCFFSAECI